ncbi:alpha-1,2-fucosyltransferase [Pedobacter miscanthi]|nr:alpha-1,2-fucosyltransferase [Pedobacter miscanthi]
MFQYAAARAFSNEKLIHIDVSFLNNNQLESGTFTPRKFELGIFKNLEINSNNNSFFLKIREENIFFRLFKKVLKRLSLLKYIDDDNIKNELEKRQNYSTYFLNGYFQNEAYFTPLREKLLQEFAFPELSILSKNIKKKILKTKHSISLHVRRGDYLKPENGLKHGILPISYYQQAIAHFNAILKEPNYFIFSDDLDWCEENLSFIESKTFVKTSGEPWEEMNLMSLCKYQIIANSSFSWWAAWLNNSADKIVIAPKKWFLNTETDIIPNEWITL